MQKSLMKSIFPMFFMLMPMPLLAQEINSNAIRRDSVPVERQLQEPMQSPVSAATQPVADFKNDISAETAPAIDPKATEMKLLENPYLIGWGGGMMAGYHGSMTDITSFRNIACVNAIQQWGNISLMSGLSASKGLANGIGVVNGFGGNLALGYALSDNISVTAIGAVNRYGLLTPAPNMTTAYYGGYFTLKTNNGKWGMDLGVRRVYDPFRGWQTIPIAMPYYNLNGQKLGLDVGGILYNVFRSAAGSVNNPKNDDLKKGGRGPAIIAPPIDTKVSFGTQEIPKWMDKQFENQ